MSLSMYNVSAAVLVKNLNSLSKILDKAQMHCDARKIEAGALLQDRLFPDMFNFTRQVQIACDFAKGICARLSETENPSFQDTEVSFDDLKARIAKTVDFIKSIPADQFVGSDTRNVTLKIRGEELTLNGLDYLRGMGLPNFYFHYTTAYNLLRHNGVEVGKSDFVNFTQN